MSVTFKPEFDGMREVFMAHVITVSGTVAVALGAPLDHLSAMYMMGIDIGLAVALADPEAARRYREMLATEARIPAEIDASDVDQVDRLVAATKA